MYASEVEFLLYPNIHITKNVPKKEGIVIYFRSLSQREGLSYCFSLTGRSVSNPVQSEMIKCVMTSQCSPTHGHGVKIIAQLKHSLC